MGNSNSLTSAQEKFAQEIVNGLTQCDAMLSAYPQRKKWKRSSLYEKASVLMKNSKITSRIEELRKPQADILEAHRTEIIQEAINTALQNKKMTTAAVSALLKLLDKLVATKNDKLDVAHSGEVNITVRDLTAK